VSEEKARKARSALTRRVAQSWRFSNSGPPTTNDFQNFGDTSTVADHGVVNDIVRRRQDILAQDSLTKEKV
jgi:hypothetical protein